MGYWLRMFAVFLIATPLAAMLAEPFFASALDHLGVDTGDWAVPLVSAMLDLFSDGWFRSASSVAIGIGAGVWLHWLATRFDKSKKATPSPARQAGMITLRSAPEIRFDCEKGISFYLAPNQNSTLMEPQNPSEGTFHLYYMQGTRPYSLSYKVCYEFDNDESLEVGLGKNELTIFRIEIISSGSGFRYFITRVTNNLIPDEVCSTQ